MTARDDAITALDAAIAEGAAQATAEQEQADQPVIDGLHQQVTDAAAANAALAAQVATLQAELAALQPSVLYGSGIGGWWESLKEPKASAYARIVAALNPKIVRIFAGSVPPYVDPNLPVSLDTGDTVTDAQILALSARGGDQFLSRIHEPNKTGKLDPSGKPWTPATWGKAQRDTLAQIQRLGVTNVHLVPTLEGQAFISARKPPITAADWFDWDLTGIDYLGGDLYQWGKSDADADTALEVGGEFIDLMKALGKRGHINELGFRRVLGPNTAPAISDAARAKFATDFVALCNANAQYVGAVMLFESDNGNDKMKPWPITHPTNPNYSPLAVAAWRAACTR